MAIQFYKKNNYFKMTIKIIVKDSELMKYFSFVWNSQNQLEEMNFELHYDDVPGDLTSFTCQSYYMLYIEVNKFINFKELDVYSQLQGLEKEFEYLTTVKAICEDEIYYKITTIFNYLKRLPLEQVFTDLQSKGFFIEDFINILEKYLADALIYNLEKQLHKISVTDSGESAKYFTLYKEECWILERFLSESEIDLYKPLNTQQCHYLLGVLYANIESAYNDNDQAFHHLQMADDFMPAQKFILPFYMAASFNENGELENPESYALAQKTAATIIAHEPDNQDAKLFLEREKIYPKSFKIAEEFNSFIGKPLKSMLFFKDYAEDMFKNTLFELKGDRNANHSEERRQAQCMWDKKYGLILRP